MSLLRKVITVYVVIKVAPVIIKGVAYIADGAVKGISNKIGRDICKVVFGEEEVKRNLRRTYSGHTERYGSYSERCKREA